MKNGCFITLKKENDIKKFFAFYDGIVRDMTNGFGEIITDFDKLYKDLVKKGYKEI